MSVTAAIRRLIADGFTLEQALAAAETFESEMAPKRTARQERNARYYQSKSVLKRLKASETSNSDASVLNKTPLARVEVSSSNLDLSREVKKEKTLLVHSHPECDFFEKFWTAYPRRDGPNPKKPAKERFLRLVAKGIDPEKLIEAASALAREHPTPTRFVPQATTWLNQHRFESEEAIAPVGNEFCSEDWPNTRFLVSRFRSEHSGSDPPRGVQGGKTGYMIPAEWVQLSRTRTAAHNGG